MNGNLYDFSRLVELREEKGKTQEQVAEDLKITQITVSRVESGKSVSIELLVRLAAYYHVPYTSLLKQPSLKAQKILAGAIT